MMLLDWQPTATFENLRLRAEVIKQIRRFFESLEVLEVETPLMGSSTATDPYLISFETELQYQGKKEKKYLQTSPEFPMKRLLSAGSGSIYQICKAFRNGEVSGKHNPEFTILEWYRVGFDHFQLMKEVEDLLTLILNTSTAKHVSYHDLFQGYFNINPHTCSIKHLQEHARNYNLNFSGEDETNRDIWLDLLLTHIIEPELGVQTPIFIFDFPASQAALAQIKSQETYQVGERFEVYYKGLELANGYHELCNPDEQLTRFIDDNAFRKQQGFPVIPIDNYFLNSLAQLPDCAGVALGIDRLICLAANTNNIHDVLTFPSSCC